ncbi:MAG TPA: hypothetical protein VF532_19275 [Candidatus Angelobacter sp.]
MASAAGELSAKLHRLANELRQVENQLQTAPAPDAAPLQEFRQALDNTRLTAWSVNEAMSAGRRDTGADSVLSFLATERLRRLDQMVRNMCADLDRQAVTTQTTGMQSLFDSVNALTSRLNRLFKK